MAIGSGFRNHEILKSGASSSPNFLHWLFNTIGFFSQESDLILVWHDFLGWQSLCWKE